MYFQPRETCEEAVMLGECWPSGRVACPGTEDPSSQQGGESAPVNRTRWQEQMWPECLSSGMSDLELAGSDSAGETLSFG